MIAESIHTLPMEGQWKVLGEGVFGGEGVQNRNRTNLPWREYGYFLELHIIGKATLNSSPTRVHSRIFYSGFLFLEEVTAVIPLTTRNFTYEKHVKNI